MLKRFRTIKQTPNRVIFITLDSSEKYAKAVRISSKVLLFWPYHNPVRDQFFVLYIANLTRWFHRDKQVKTTFPAGIYAPALS